MTRRALGNIQSQLFSRSLKMIHFVKHNYDLLFQ